MFKTSADIEIKHKRFIKDVIKSEEIWTLKNEKGYVSSTSNHFENENKEALLIQVFWSSKVEAKYCSTKIWQNENFEIDIIPLNEFIELWCIGMHRDNVIAGTNFDLQLFGHEEEPLILAKDLLESAKQNKVKLNFQNYNSIDEFLNILYNNIN